MAIIHIATGYIHVYIYISIYICVYIYIYILSTYIHDIPDLDIPTIATGVYEETFN